MTTRELEAVSRDLSKEYDEEALMPKKQSEIVRLTIILDQVKPLVWRKLLVPASTKLPALHRIFQIAMGWENQHQHLFEGEGICYGPEDLETDMDEMGDERRVTLERLVKESGGEFLYLYDLGDRWEHRVTVDVIVPPNPRVQYPICIGGARACPPEDSGGPDGYEQFLQTISDPSEKDHDDLVAWIGGYFDSEGFDLNGVNRRLRPFRKGGSSRRGGTPESEAAVSADA